MITLAVKKAQILSLTEKAILAKAGLNFVKTITMPEVSSSIAEANSTLGKKVANATLTKGILNNIASDSGSNLINTNISASIMTNIEMPLEYISNIYNNKKLIYPSVDKTIPIRCAIEFPIMNKFLNSMDNYIEKIVVTADSIPIAGRTHNINRDLIVSIKTDNNVSMIDKDIKAGKLDLDKLLSGHIRQIETYQDQIISYPNDICTKETITEYYTELTRHLKNLSLTSLSNSNRNNYFGIIEEIHDTLKNGKPILQNVSTIENKLMMLQQITVKPNISFLNIHKISEQELTPDEMDFLNKLMPYIDNKLLQKPSYMHNYLIEALKLYKKIIDPKALDQIKIFSKSYTWVKKGLPELPLTFYT